MDIYVLSAFDVRLTKKELARYLVQFVKRFSRLRKNVEYAFPHSDYTTEQVTQAISDVVRALNVLESFVTDSKPDKTLF